MDPQGGAAKQGPPPSYRPAAESSVLQRPSSDSMPARWQARVHECTSVRFTPTLPAAVQAPSWSARAARWVVTREEEQAVSTVRAGPLKPKE